MRALTVHTLTPMQQRFVEVMVQSGDQVRAAEVAGYAFSSAGADLARNPKIQRAIAEGIASRLLTEGAPIAYALLAEVVRDKAVSARVRVDAAKTILDRGGFVPPKAAEPGGMEKTVTEMSRDELRAFITIAENHLANAAVDVTPPAAEAEHE
jgi:phage terminase small subunit